jgi:GLPGLI family protein
MKFFIFPILILFISDLSYSQDKEILYKINIKRKFSDVALKKFKKRKDKEKAKQEIQAYQNPKNEFYSLKLSNNKIKLDYVIALDNDDKKTHVEVKNYPLGKQSFRIKDDTLVYYKYEFYKDSYYSVDTLVKDKWIETQKDSTLLGYNVSQIKLETEIGTYKAWYTKELPTGLGIGSLSSSKGFIIAYEFSYKPTSFLDSHIIKAYPYKQKKLKRNKKFDFRIPDKIYSDDEIKEIFRKRNEVLNKPVEIEN